MDSFTESAEIVLVNGRGYLTKSLIFCSQKDTLRYKAVTLYHCCVVAGCESVWSQRPGASGHQDHQEQEAIPESGSDRGETSGTDE